MELNIKQTVLVGLLVSLLAVTACGDEQATNGTGAQQPMTDTAQTPTAEPTVAPAQEPISEGFEPAPGVVYQDEIYKNWPYTEAPAMGEVKEPAQAALEEVTASAEEKAAVVAEASDKPYQLVDGNISANAIEGWKTYNGGGCGACHGKGGIGAVGPNLADSVTNKLSKEEFINIVTNGMAGTMMRPNKTNKRVMDNLDNLYAYLVARGDGVLGPDNLIKFPLGKNE